MLFAYRLLASEGVEVKIGQVHVVINEILFNHVALVAKANDEMVKPVVGIAFHDMPKNRSPPDRNHRFWLTFGFLLQSGPFSAAKNDDGDWLTILHRWLE